MRRKILVVEDEKILRELLADALSEDGYDVEQVSTGDRAWELIENGLSLDILLTDVRMPGQIDGLELARKVKSTAGDVSIWVMSGYTGANHVDPQIAQFIAKPFTSHRLVSLISGHARS